MDLLGRFPGAFGQQVIVGRGQGGDAAGKVDGEGHHGAFRVAHQFAHGRAIDPGDEQAVRR